MSTNVAAEASRPGEPASQPAKPASPGEIRRRVFAELCRDQSRCPMTPPPTNWRTPRWRRGLNIAGIYLGRSRPRIIHSRAPAADGEGLSGLSNGADFKCVRSAQSADTRRRTRDVAKVGIWYRQCLQNRKCSSLLFRDKCNKSHVTE